MSMSARDAARAARNVAIANADAAEDAYAASLAALIPAPVPVPVPPVPSPVPGAGTWIRQSLLDATKESSALVPPNFELSRWLSVPGWQTDQPCRIQRVGGRYVVTFKQGAIGGRGNGSMEYNSPSPSKSRRVELLDFGLSANFQQHPVETKLALLCQNSVYITLAGKNCTPMIAVQGQPAEINVPGFAGWGSGPLPNNVPGVATVTLAAGAQLPSIAILVGDLGNGLYLLELSVNGYTVSSWRNVKLPTGPGGTVKFNPIWGGGGGIVSADMQLSLRAIDVLGA